MFEWVGKRYLVLAISVLIFLGIIAAVNAYDSSCTITSADLKPYKGCDGYGCYAVSVLKATVSYTGNCYQYPGFFQLDAFDMSTRCIISYSPDAAYLGNMKGITSAYGTLMTANGATYTLTEYYSIPTIPAACYNVPLTNIYATLRPGYGKSSPYDAMQYQISTIFTGSIKAITLQPASCLSVETCNGFDDNCNGFIDEGFNLQTDVNNCGTCGYACGVNQQCINSQCSCAQGEMTNEGCNQEGACYGSFKTCDNGAFGECNVLPQAEVCNNLDDNCDGQIDENNPCPTGQYCVSGACRACTDTDPTDNIYIAGSRTFAGEASNSDYCSALTPNAVIQANCYDYELSVTPCPTGTICTNGICAYPAGYCTTGTTRTCYINNGYGSCRGTQTCNSGAYGSCTGNTPAPEICNNLDENCDGIIDDNNPCPTGQTCTNGICIQVCNILQGQTCYSPYNICLQRNIGTYDCNGVCTATTPSDTTCANCAINSQPPGSAANCMCGNTLSTLSSWCCYSTSRGYESYNSRPNDNNNCGSCGNTCLTGQTCTNGQCTYPAGYCTTGTTRTCYINNGYGSCRGTQTCNSGAYGSCTGNTPKIETCNNLDDNCDGIIDNGFNKQTDNNNCGTCGKVCTTGQTCISGTCTDTAPTKCAINSQPPGSASSCWCGSTLSTLSSWCCYSTSTGYGTYYPTPNDNNNCGICNNKCATGTTCSNGVCKECITNRECQNLYPLKPYCDLTTAKCIQCRYASDCASTETCTNSICTSAAGYCTTGTTRTCYINNGYGSCRGTQTCNSGAYGSCTGNTPAPEICNGLDENCDELIDNGLAIPTQSCYITNAYGTCTGTQVRTCRGATGWSVFGTCNAATPAKETCNNIDDNCDGIIDNGFNKQTDNNNCGICNNKCATGTTCSNGVCKECITNRECQNLYPLKPYCDLTTAKCIQCRYASDCASTETCTNSICTSAAGYCTTGTTRTCYINNGYGSCRGTQTCNSGAYGSCTGNTPAPEICNGLDENCDELIDNGLAIPTQSCYITNAYGTCTGTQVRTCRGATGWSVFGTCNAATPAKETCNNIDDNCDGIIDNGFNKQTDNNNCGTCGRKCGSQQTCVGGTCQDIIIYTPQCLINSNSPPESAAQCTCGGFTINSGEWCCYSASTGYGTYFPDPNDVNNCGTCGNSCQAGEICDPTTLNCQSGGLCITEDDCAPYPDTPHCDMTTGFCVGCRDNNDCSAGETCNPFSLQCEPGTLCVSEDDCILNPIAKHCDLASGFCVECRDNNDCGAGQICNALFMQCEDIPTDPCNNQCDHATEYCDDIPGSLTYGTCQPINGCTSDAQCIDNPMAPYCDTATGFCVECRTSANCFSGATCENGICIYYPLCQSDADCLPGQTCNILTGTCESGSGCSSEDDCMLNPVAPHCDLASGFCVECRDNNDCSAGQTCNLITSQCEIADPCNGLCDIFTQYCDDIPTSPTYRQCLPYTAGCTDDQYCADLNPFAPICDMLTGDCIQCRSTGDCGPAETCDNGFCAYNPGCQSDTDCQPGETCNTATGTCEPNNLDCNPPCNPVTQYCDPITVQCQDIPTDSCNGMCDPATEYCDDIPGSQTYGQCKSNNGGCSNNQDCLDLNPFTPICDTNTGNCIQCQSAQDCFPGETCDNGFCAYNPGCQSDTDCQPGETCNTATGTCEPNALDCNPPCDLTTTYCDLTTTPPICKPNNPTDVCNGQCDLATQYCDDIPGSITYGSCVDNNLGCSNNQDCSLNPFAPYCNVVTGDCVQCLNNGQCQSGETCDTSGICVPGVQCQSDAECNAGETCNIITGICEPNALDCNPPCDLTTTYCDLTTTPPICKPNNPTDICNGQCDLATQYCDDIPGSITYGSCVDNTGSCSSDLQCADNPFAPYCNTLTGVCIQCRTTAECQAGEACDTSGICIYLGLCSTDDECLPGETCDTNSGTCMPGAGCTTNLECSAIDPTTPFCDMVTGSCIQCMNAEDCLQPQETCNNGQCELLTDICNPECDATQVCINSTCEPLIQCTNDLQCTDLTKPHCDADSGQCIECISNFDCAVGICQFGSCNANCTSDIDCLAGQVCDQATKKCSFATGGYCGDNIVERPNANNFTETCDGSNVNGFNCSIFGIDSGNILCTANCSEYDVSECLNFTFNITCTDSDGGKNYFVRGSAGNDFIPAGELTTDICDVTDPGYIVEYYCDSDNFVMTEYHKCPGECSNGACIDNTAPGLVASYGFDEAQGDVIFDYSIYDNNGIATNTLWGSGKFNTGLYFNGMNSRVIVNDSQSLNITNALTLEAWINPSGYDTDINSIISKWMSPNGAYFIGYYNMSPMIQVVTSGGKFTIRDESTRLTPGTWSHIAGTYNGSSLRLYVNGVLKASNNSMVGDIKTVSYPLVLGALSWINIPQYDFFNGTVDSVKIYNKALTQFEIRVDMNNTNNTQCNSALDCEQSVCNDGTLTKSCTQGRCVTTKNCTTIPPGMFCGNNITEKPNSQGRREVCDGSDVNGMTCQDFNFLRGKLKCINDCSQYDKSQCTNSTGGGSVYYCGDNLIEKPNDFGVNETCDGANLASNTCASLLGTGYTGLLKCNSNCLSYNITMCTYTNPSTQKICGDGIIDRPDDNGVIEVCDTSNLESMSCESLGSGFTGGTLFCRYDCTGFDTSVCTSDTLQLGQNICGDGVIQTPNMDGLNEECDGANLGGLSCLKKGFTSGTVSCSQNCTLDTSLCSKIDLISQEEALAIAKEKYDIYQVYSIELLNIDNRMTYQIKGRVRFAGFLPVLIIVDVDAVRS